MKKRFLPRAAFAVVLAAAAFGAGSASANNGNGAATAFKATYDFAGITFTCSGAHVVNNNYTQDSETCLLSGDVGLAPGTTTFGYGVWTSDFSGPGWPYQTILDQTVTFTYAANGDGTFTLGVLARF